MKKHFKENIWLYLALLVMIVLFISSSMTYKQQTSVPTLHRWLASQPGKELLSKISFKYAGTTESIKNIGYFKFVEFFIRKGAHFGTYLFIGAFGFLGLFKYIKRYILTVIVTYLGTVGYAALDEFHQMLTGGRTPLFQDVMLDGMGGLTGIAIAMICLLIFQYRMRKRA